MSLCTSTISEVGCQGVEDGNPGPVVECEMTFFLCWYLKVISRRKPGIRIFLILECLRDLLKCNIAHVTER